MESLVLIREYTLNTIAHIFDLALILGILASFVVGFLIIKFLMNYLKKGNFKIFAIYRIIFGIIIIILALTRM